MDSPCECGIEPSSSISHGVNIAGDPGLISGQEHIFSNKEYLFLARGLTISHGYNIAGDPGLISGQEHIFFQ